VEFLGHNILASIQPTIEKVDAICHAPEPNDISQPCLFLGAVNYQKFLSDLSTVLASLYHLLQKNVEWSWGLSQCKTMEDGKKLLKADCVFAYFDSSKDLVLASNAFLCGVGAVFSHKLIDGSERPTTFVS